MSISLSNKCGWEVEWVRVSTLLILPAEQGAGVGGLPETALDIKRMFNPLENLESTVQPSAANTGNKQNQKLYYSGQ